MGLKTIETVAEVSQDRVVSLRVPPEITPGRHRVVAVIDDGVEKDRNGPDVGRAWTFPVLEGTCWPEGMVLRREDLYDE